jgi:hypothetical protein
VSYLVLHQQFFLELALAGLASSALPRFLAATPLNTAFDHSPHIHSIHPHHLEQPF